MPLTLKKFNQRPLPPKTFTITWTEQSNMSSGWTYSDDATGLTAGDGAFDDFFGYSAVLLNTNGEETSTMEQSGGVFTGRMSSLGNISSGDNVMIKFPIRGIKMSKSGSVVTLSITEELNKDGYQYYAFQTGQINNITGTKNCFYLGAYKAYSSSNVLKSWSGQSPDTSRYINGFCDVAKANNSNKLWNIQGFYQRMYINALYMMKYGNPDSISVIGKGYLQGNASTGNTNNITSATYGTQWNTDQMKLFGLEDIVGYAYEFIGGAYKFSGSYELYTQLSGYTGIATGGVSTGDTMGMSNFYCLSSIIGSNKSLFATKNTLTTNTYTSYYKTYNSVLSNGIIFCAGGQGNSGNGATVLQFKSDLTTARGQYYATRLMFLPDGDLTL